MKANGQILSKGNKRGRKKKFSLTNWKKERERLSQQQHTTEKKKKKKEGEREREREVLQKNQKL